MKKGDKWVLKGRIVTVIEVGERPTRGPGIFICAVPERSLEERRAVSGPTLKAGEPHFTDWIPERAFMRAAEPYIEGETKIEPRRAAPRLAKEAVAEAVAAERSKPKRKPLDTGQKLRNRVNSLKYKLRHPEKHGRSKWTTLEKAEINDLINAAEEDFARSKGKGKA